MNHFRITATALIIQVFATGFLFIDGLRVASRTPSEGFRLGDPSWADWFPLIHWYTVIGFGLLFVGFGLEAYVLFSSRPKSQIDPAPLLPEPTHKEEQLPAIPTTSEEIQDS